MNVHVLVPAHGGFAVGTPAETVRVRRQLSSTVGGTGAVAFAAHATVDDPPAGIVTVGAVMVYVYIQSIGIPSHPMYVNVHVFVPAHGGSGVDTPADGVTVLPHASIIVGGVGATANAGHATVDEPFAGNVKDEGSTVYVYTQL